MDDDEFGVGKDEQEAPNSVEPLEGEPENDTEQDFPPLPVTGVLGPFGFEEEPIFRAFDVREENVGMDIIEDNVYFRNVLEIAADPVKFIHVGDDIDLDVSWTRIVKELPLFEGYFRVIFPEGSTKLKAESPKMTFKTKRQPTIDVTSELEKVISELGCVAFEKVVIMREWVSHILLRFDKIQLKTSETVVDPLVVVVYFKIEKSLGAKNGKLPVFVSWFQVHDYSQQSFFHRLNENYLILNTKSAVTVWYQGKKVFEKIFPNGRNCKISEGIKQSARWSRVMRKNADANYLSVTVEVKCIMWEVLPLCFYDGVLFLDFHLLAAFLKCGKRIEDYRYLFYENVFLNKKMFVEGRLNIEEHCPEMIQFVSLLFWMKNQENSCFSLLSLDVIMYAILPFISERDRIMANDEVSCLVKYDLFSNSSSSDNERNSGFHFDEIGFAQKSPKFHDIHIQDDHTMYGRTYFIPKTIFDCKCEFEENCSTDNIYNLLLLINHWSHSLEEFSSQKINEEILTSLSEIIEDAMLFKHFFHGERAFVFDFHLIVDKLNKIEKSSGVVWKKLVRKTILLFERILGLSGVVFAKLREKKFFVYEHCFHRSVLKFFCEQFVIVKLKYRGNITDILLKLYEHFSNVTSDDCGGVNSSTLAVTTRTIVENGFKFYFEEKGSNMKTHYNLGNLTTVMKLANMCVKSHVDVFGKDDVMKIVGFFPKFWNSMTKSKRGSVELVGYEKQLENSRFSDMECVVFSFLNRVFSNDKFKSIIVEHFICEKTGFLLPDSFYTQNPVHVCRWILNIFSISSEISKSTSSKIFKIIVVCGKEVNSISDVLVFLEVCVSFFERFYVIDEEKLKSLLSLFEEIVRNFSENLVNYTSIGKLESVREMSTVNPQPDNAFDKIVTKGFKSMTERMICTLRSDLSSDLSSDEDGKIAETEKNEKEKTKISNQETSTDSAVLGTTYSSGAPRITFRSEKKFGETSSSVEVFVTCLEFVDRMMKIKINIGYFFWFSQNLEELFSSFQLIVSSDVFEKVMKVSKSKSKIERIDVLVDLSRVAEVVKKDEIDLMHYKKLFQGQKGEDETITRAIFGFYSLIINSKEDDEKVLVLKHLMEEDVLKNLAEYSFCRELLNSFVMFFAKEVREINSIFSMSDSTKLVVVNEFVMITWKIVVNPYFEKWKQREYNFFSLTNSEREEHFEIIRLVQFIVDSVKGSFCKEVIRGIFSYCSEAMEINCLDAGVKTKGTASNLLLVEQLVTNIPGTTNSEENPHCDNFFSLLKIVNVIFEKFVVDLVSLQDYKRTLMKLTRIVKKSFSGVFDASNFGKGFTFTYSLIKFLDLLLRCSSNLCFLEIVELLSDFVVFPMIDERVLRRIGKFRLSPVFEGSDGIFKSLFEISIKIVKLSVSPNEIHETFKFLVGNKIFSRIEKELKYEEVLSDWRFETYEAIVNLVLEKFGEQAEEVVTLSIREDLKRLKEKSFKEMDEDDVKKNNSLSGIPEKGENMLTGDQLTFENVAKLFESERTPVPDPEFSHKSTTNEGNEDNPEFDFSLGDIDTFGQNSREKSSPEGEEMEIFKF